MQRMWGEGRSRQATDGQFSHFLQGGFHLVIELTISIIVADRVGEVALNAAELVVAGLVEAKLEADHGLETGIKIGDAQVDDLRQFFVQAVVVSLEDLLRLITLLLGSNQLRGVVGRLLR